MNDKQLPTLLLQAHGQLAQTLFIEMIKEGDAPKAAAMKSIQAATTFLEELTRTNYRFYNLLDRYDNLKDAVDEFLNGK